MSHIKHVYVDNISDASGWGSRALVGIFLFVAIESTGSHIAAALDRQTEAVKEQTKALQAQTQCPVPNLVLEK